MGLQRITVTYPPVSLDDLKAHLRIDGTDDDATLAAYNLAATEYVESETRQSVLYSKWLLTFDCFPKERFIKIPRPPLTSIESIIYIDAAGNQQTLSPDIYIVDSVTFPGRVVLRPGQAWPETDRSANCVSVTYYGGYISAELIPPTMIHAIKLMVGHYYENREAATDRRIDEVPLAVQTLVGMNSYPEAIG